MEGFLIESLLRHVGQTVTIFTTSGGLSGAGFTGVLAGICDKTVKLITDIGAPPACPVGSSCCSYGDGFGYGGGYGGGYSGYGYGGGCGGYGGGYGGGCGCGGYGGGCGGYGGYGYGGGYGFGGGFGYGYNWLGSVTEIPIDRIASFTHNAI